MSRWKETMARMGPWKAKLERLGNIGLVVHLSVFALTMLSMVIVLKYGLASQLPWFRDHPEATSGATFVTAYALTKLVTIPRLMFTVAVTPLILRWTGRPAPEPTEG